MQVIFSDAEKQSFSQEELTSAFFVAENIIPFIQSNLLETLCTFQSSATSRPNAFGTFNVLSSIILVQIFNLG